MLMIGSADAGSGRPVSTSHRVIVPLLPATASVRPSGVKAARKMFWMQRSRRNSLPVAVSKRITSYG
jgi:hypothetical protein